MRSRAERAKRVYNDNHRGNTLPESKRTDGSIGQLTDNRVVASAQKEVQVMANNSPQARKAASWSAMLQQRETVQLVQNPVQRTIADIASWDDFVAEYQRRNGGESPVPVFQAGIEAAIASDQAYTYETAFDFAMERAMEAHADEVEAVDVYVRVADLVPQLDPAQHRPDLVAYDRESGAVTQTPPSADSDVSHYGQTRLEHIRDVQNAGEVDEDAVASIFFEILEENADVPITTGDGRHRIAIYHAMGVAWIRASVTASQRAVLEGRGIAVQDEAG